MQLKERLIKLRKKYLLSQNDLAKQIYVSRSTIAKWESGTKNPTEQNLKDLNEFYDLKNNPLILDVDQDTQTTVRKKVKLKPIDILKFNWLHSLVYIIICILLLHV